jgi:hypothetical protein
MAMATVVSLALANLRVDLGSNSAFFALIAVLFVASAFYYWVRPEPRLQAVTEAAGQILLILLFGILLSYAATTPDLPYQDAALYAADGAIGFDRAAYLAFFAAHPWLKDLISACYLTLLPQFILVPAILFVTGREARVQTLLIGLGIALMVTSAVDVFMPSLTATVYVDFGGAAHVPAGVYTPAPTLEALRQGTMHSFVSTTSKVWSASPASIPQARCCSSGPCGRFAGCAGWQSRSTRR